MSVDEVQNGIIEEFAQLGDWMERYEMLIDMGRDLPAIDPAHKVRDFLIEGCQSKVWLYPQYDGDYIHFTADSDALITRGIVALLIRVLSGRKPAEILNADLYFIDRIGLKQNLSPTRANGLLAMMKQMKLYAMAFEASGKSK